MALEEATIGIKAYNPTVIRTGFHQVTGERGTENIPRAQEGAQAGAPG